MRYQFHEFVFGDAILACAPQMERQLLGAIEGHQRSHGNQTPVAFGKAGAFPDVAEENLLGEFRQLGGDSPIIPRATDLDGSDAMCSSGARNAPASIITLRPDMRRTE